MRSLRIIPLVAVLAVAGGAQERRQAPPSDPPPRHSDSSDKPYSSSRDTQLPQAVPPGQAEPPPPLPGQPPRVHELRPYNPHRAMKNVEVGEFYLKRRNYAAALSRFREALEHKPNDAIATFRVAQTLERMEEFEEALEFYYAYLKILPNGPLSKQARAGVERLQARAETAAAEPPRL
jgi:tetratricopeptide (TPR) repeat protein